MNILMDNNIYIYTETKSISRELRPEKRLFFFFSLLYLRAAPCTRAPFYDDGNICLRDYNT